MPEPTSLTSAVATAGFKALASTLAKSVVEGASQQLRSILNTFNIDFGPHLEANFERCLKVKTILNKAEPVDLLSIYVNTLFSHGNDTIDDFRLIEQIPQKRRILITGTGGGGKTIFMKYLWLSLFSNPNGRIPVFVELRRLNELSSDDLLAYIFRSIIDAKSSITEDYFKKATQDGLFTFILDGFDEINHEKRDSIERQILKFVNTNPEAIVIVSGRPDDRFDAWQAFSNYKVKPLQKKQVIELIGKLQYEKKIRQKFIARIKSDLYEKHPSFLSSPLLSTMMLLTFDQFAEIPEKVFLFYEQAFDTLFLKHDATKEGFQRKKHSDLTIDVFKRYLSFFCMTSYYDEKFEFTDTEILKYAEKAFKANNAKVSKTAFVKDLVESICLMQKDGLVNVFTHRSFQEYFTAYCLSNYIDEQFKTVLEHLMARHSDNVIHMLFEMNKEKTEKLFVIPLLDELMQRCDQHNCTTIAGHQEIFEYRLHLGQIGKEWRLFVGSGNKYYDFISVLHRIYPSQSANIQKRMNGFRKTDQTAIDNLVKKYGLSTAPNGDFIDFKNLPEPIITEKRNRKAITLPLSDIAESGFATYAASEIAFARQLAADVAERNAKLRKSIDDILGLTPKRR